MIPGLLPTTSRLERKYTSGWLGKLHVGEFPVNLPGLQIFSPAEAQRHGIPRRRPGLAECGAGGQALVQPFIDIGIKIFAKLSIALERSAGVKRHGLTDLLLVAEIDIPALPLLTRTNVFGGE